MNEFHEIIGNTTTTPNPQSDWNQKNDERPDYIKNKPILGDLAGKSKVSLSDLDESIQQTLSNAIVVNEDGRASVGADPVDPMDIVTKRYVDSRPGGGGGSGAQAYVQDTEPVDAPIGSLWFDTSVLGITDVKGVEF